jgi:hypothetical protein|tara:strand:+ start:119 stop:316 length:198 start_codon:yes stop_codon:yes gene_type:complete
LWAFQKCAEGESMSYEDVVNQELIKRIQEILKDWRNGEYGGNDEEDAFDALYDIETEVHEAVGEE